MGVVEISGPIREEMWYYGEPFLDMPVLAPRAYDVDFQEKYRGRVFTQMVEMCMQTATYLETAAHVDADREDIDEVPLERAWMVPTVVLHTLKAPREKVTLDGARRSLDDQGVTIEPGDAVLVHTGWDSVWDDPARYLSDMPYLSRELVYWLIEQKIGILGCDTARADSLCALPLAIDGACASPVRAVLVTD